MDDNCNNILMSDKIDSLAIALSKAQVAIENVKKINKPIIINTLILPIAYKQ